jgi:hypothetical protein
VSDFNAFINHAYNDNPPLNFLELEIPGKVLEHFRLFSYIFNGPNLYIRGPTDGKHKKFHLCINGYKIDGSYDPTSKEKEFQLNKGETCKLIDYHETETKWEKVFKLNKKDTFKFKFYFQQCGKHHEVILWGQKFYFLSFRFDLRRPTGTKFSCKSAADFDKYKKAYRIPQFYSTPQERVAMLENTGAKFKFKFYPSYEFYNFGSPLKTLDPNYFEENINNLEYSYLNFQNNIHYTGVKYDMSQNFNFQNNFDDVDEEFQNFNLKQPSFFEEYDGFEQNSFFQENIFDEKNSIEENINPEIFEKRFSSDTFYFTKNEETKF